MLQIFDNTAVKTYNYLMFVEGGLTGKKIKNYTFKRGEALV